MTATNLPFFGQYVDSPVRARAASWTYGALFTGYFLYALVGLHPFADGTLAERADGSPLDRVYVIALFALALVTLALNARAAWARLSENPAAAAMVAIALASLAWSDYPEFTLRRALLLALLAVAAWAVAAGAPTMRRFHTLLFAALAAVVALNLLAILAFPGAALSDLGAKGLYTQKNVAGLIAMLAAIVAATWTAGAARGRERLLGAIVTALSFVFLVSSRSKTSEGLAVGALGLAALLALARRAGPAYVALLAALASLAGAALIVTALAFDLDPSALLALLPVDPTFTGRDDLWRFAIDRAMQAPWLGHGYGAFWDVGAAHDPLARIDPGTWLGDVEPGVINQAHDGYLELWLELGAPATVLATLAILKGAFVSARSAWSARRGDARSAYAMLALALGVFLVHNLTEATLFVRGTPLFSVAFVCLLLSAKPWREEP